MLKIVIDPRGMVVADSLVVEEVDKIISRYKHGFPHDVGEAFFRKDVWGTVYLTIGQSLLLDGIRLAMLQGKISHEEIEIYKGFNGPKIDINEYGALSEDPFSDCPFFAEEILKLAVKKRKENRPNKYHGDECDLDSKDNLTAWGFAKIR